MNNKKDEILKLVSEYINEKKSNKQWEAGKDFVQYSGPFFNDKEIVSAIETILDGWWVLGDKCLKFEKEFPQHLGKSHGVFVNSGSSANLLMLSYEKRGKQFYFSEDRPRILLPAAGFPTTINPSILLEFEPVFCDIELDTLNIDLNEAEKILEEYSHHYVSDVHCNIKYLMFAHVLGNPPNMDKVMELVKKYNLTLLEDCCDGLGTTYDGKPLGSFGKLSSCSFYPAHHMCTGEGGFVACDSLEDKRILTSLRDWGRGCYCSGKNASLSKKGCCGKRFSEWLSSLPNEVLDHKYIYNEIGYNLKPLELQAAIGLIQLSKLDEIHDKRKGNYTLLYKIFEKYEEFFILPKPQNKADVSWFAFPLTMKDNAPFKKHDLTNYLENNKIQTRNYFGGNLLLQPAYSKLFSKEYALKFKNATKVTTDTFFLGTSPVITNEQINYIETVVDKFMKKT